MLAAYGLLAALRDDTAAVPAVAGSLSTAGARRCCQLQGMPGTWQERECLHVARPDDREVPVVKRGDLGQPKALGNGRHGGIDDAKRKIKISLTSSAMRPISVPCSSATLNPSPSNDRRKVTSAWVPSRQFLPSQTGSSHPPVAYRVARLSFSLVRPHRMSNGAGKTTLRRKIRRTVTCRAPALPDRADLESSLRPGAAVGRDPGGSARAARAGPGAMGALRAVGRAIRARRARKAPGRVSFTREFRVRSPGAPPGGLHV